MDRNLLFQPHPEVVADDHGIQPKRFTQASSLRWRRCSMLL
ncbi:hypothetical protein J2046_005584 [Rhizobium petrolearium]|uniref:Uncharacterized protein n=2 Tax=Neorhizobium TaxID=1525371 RepID=A0ABV0MA72_9HYPH|nr:hypothetical protein [Neorhizobium petrolearium]MBP1847300.1 hypothetical protein [Neorhizobium petrolearium]WGI72441.1 hypothetical protein QEO92_31545 [Neorhizobium petrolearium]